MEDPLQKKARGSRRGLFFWKLPLVLIEPSLLPQGFFVHSVNAPVPLYEYTRHRYVPLVPL
jgi:hypothetical protein